MAAKKEKVNPFLAQLNKQKEGVSGLFRPKFMEIAIDDLFAEKQIRKKFENAENTIENLAVDISVRGIKHPLVVTPVGDKYKILTGERRYRAAKIAGFEAVPCVIEYDYDEKKRTIDQLLENIQRMDLTLEEEVEALQESLKYNKPPELWKKLNKTSAWLSKRLALLDLPEHTDKLLKTKAGGDDLNLIHEVKKIETDHPDVAKQLVDELVERHKTKSTKKTSSTNEDSAASVSQKQKDKGVTAREIVDKYKRIISNDSGGADVLFERLYDDVVRAKVPNHLALEQFEESDTVLINDTLVEFFKQGKSTENRISYCINGFRDGLFSVKDYRVLFFAAFLCGVDNKEPSISDVLGYLNSDAR